MFKKVYIPSLFCTFILIGIILIFSCGAQRTYQTKSPPGGFASYVIVEILDFKTSVNPVPPDVIWKIPNEIAEKLRKELLFTGVSRSPVDLSDRVLILDGTMVGYTPTVWYKRLVNTGRAIATVRFIDKSENKVIAEASFEGTAQGGMLFGGGMLFADRRLADEVVQYIKRNYSPQ